MLTTSNLSPWETAEVLYVDPHRPALRADEHGARRAPCDSTSLRGTSRIRRGSRETRRPDGPVAREFGTAGMPAGDRRQKQ